MIIGHGGNKQHLAKTLGCRPDDIIDMSSNLNPIGPPERIEKVILENLSEIRSLPEPDAASMRRGFAVFHGVNPDMVVAGNGTTWFIYTIPNALNTYKILILGPTYSDYKDAAVMNGAGYKHYFLSPDTNFSLDVEQFSKRAEQADLVFICNPNNPTGTLLPKETLLWLIKSHPDTLFVIDESYLPFVDSAEQHSLVSDTKYSNLIVLASMSKIFRIPGLRTGFLRSTPEICEKMMDYYQPWSVNSLAQAVICDIFNHPEAIPGFYENTRQYTNVEKKVFLDSLDGINSIYCYPSSTYFVLAKLSGSVRSDALCQEIGKNKILIRDCANFEGLSDSFVRFSLKDRSRNLALSGLLKEFLNRV